MINFYDYTDEKKIDHNSKQSFITDHPCRIFVVSVSGSGKTNPLSNLINNQPHIYTTYLYQKDPYQVKCQYLINKREKLGFKHYDDPKSIIEYSNDMQMFIKILKNAILEDNVKY